MFRVQYLCSDSGTRVRYSATEVVNPPYPKATRTTCANR